MALQGEGEETNTLDLPTSTSQIVYPDEHTFLPANICFKIEK